MAFSRVEVWLIKYPYSDLSSTKVRPAVVCSTDAYHHEQPDIMVAALTSNVSAAVASFDYVLQDWATAGLRFESALKPVIATLDPALAVHRIGKLSATDMAEIDQRLRASLGL